MQGEVRGNPDMDAISAQGGRDSPAPPMYWEPPAGLAHAVAVAFGGGCGIFAGSAFESSDYERCDVPGPQRLASAHTCVEVTLDSKGNFLIWGEPRVHRFLIVSSRCDPCLGVEALR